MKKTSLILIALLLLPLVSATLQEDIAAVKDKVQNFIDNEETAVIIKGTYASPTERIALEYLKTYPKIANIKVIEEEDLEKTNIEGKTLLLLGGPTQNMLSYEVLNNKEYSSEKDKITMGTITYLTSNNSKVMVFSDNSGYHNLPKRVNKSPLSKIIPKNLVPTIASFIGLGLLWIWQFLAKLLLKIFRFKASSKIMKFIKKKEITKEYLGFKIKGMRIKFREWTAIKISALVFAVSLSFMYLAPNVNKFLFLLLTVLVNIIVYSVRHLTRLYLDKKHKLHTEYRVWYWGAIVTAITGYLGNTFCLAGYIASEADYSKYEAKNSYMVNLVTFAVFIIFWIWNLLSPSIVLQMIMILSLAITFLQMLPLSPFAGKNIYRWNKKIWWKTFIPLAIMYILVNLIV